MARHVAGCIMSAPLRDESEFQYVGWMAEQGESGSRYKQDYFDFIPGIIR
jgi:hypothetical protein